jgi:hypothetical protein
LVIPHTMAGRPETLVAKRTFGGEVQQRVRFCPLS